MAFGLDAGWDYRGELRQESEMLQALDAEFKANRVSLELDIEFVRAYTDASRRLLMAANLGSIPADQRESLGLDLWSSLSWRTANISTTTLDAAVSAGRLDLVRDDSLRVALAGWRARVEDMAEEEVFEWREITERYRPYMGQFVAIPSLEGDTIPRATLSADELQRLLHDRAFRSHLSMRVDVSLVSLDDKVDTLAELDRVVELLRDAS